MVFDDDVKLVGLYQRYEDEVEEMKKQIVNYINSETFGQEQMQQQELNDVSHKLTNQKVDVLPSRHTDGNEKAQAHAITCCGITKTIKVGTGRR